jgi:hypothetical protein
LYSRAISFCSKRMDPYVWMVGNFHVRWLTFLISGMKLTKI